MVNSSVCVVGDYVNCDVEWSLDYCRFHVSTKPLAFPRMDLERGEGDSACCFKPT